MKNKTYWHVTTEENVDSIKKHGLVANTSGYINVIKQLEIITEHTKKCFSVADYIAARQVRIQKYILVTVNSKGIKKTVRGGDSFPADTWGRIKQPFIDPKFLTFSEAHTVNIHDLAKLSAILMSEMFDLKVDNLIQKEQEYFLHGLELGYSSDLGIILTADYLANVKRKYLPTYE